MIVDPRAAVGAQGWRPSARPAHTDSDVQAQTPRRHTHTEPSNGSVEHVPERLKHKIHEGWRLKRKGPDLCLRNPSQLHVQTGMYVLAPFYALDNTTFNSNTFFISARFLVVKHKTKKGAN